MLQNTTLQKQIEFSIFDLMWVWCFFFSSRRRHTRFDCDWSSDVCSSDLTSPGSSSWLDAVTLAYDLVASISSTGTISLSLASARTARSESLRTSTAAPAASTDRKSVV